MNKYIVKYYIPLISNEGYEHIQTLANLFYGKGKTKGRLYIYVEAASENEAKHRAQDQLKNLSLIKLSEVILVKISDITEAGRMLSLLDTKPDWTRVFSDNNVRIYYKIEKTPQFEEMLRKEMGLPNADNMSIVIYHGDFARQSLHISHISLPESTTGTLNYLDQIVAQLEDYEHMLCKNLLYPQEYVQLLKNLKGK